MTLAIKGGKAVRNLSRSQHDIKVTTSIEGVRPTADHYYIGFQTHTTEEQANAAADTTRASISLY